MMDATKIAMLIGLYVGHLRLPLTDDEREIIRMRVVMAMLKDGQTVSPRDLEGLNHGIDGATRLYENEDNTNWLGTVE